MEKRKVERNYVVMRDKTFQKLNLLKAKRQEVEPYLVTNDIIIAEALEMYERQSKRKS